MIIRIWGVVQGVGFRPTVYRLAKRLGLRGYVRNLGGMVEICINGDAREFLDLLVRELRPPAKVEGYEILPGECEYRDFVILESGGEPGMIPIPPDLAICDECLKELFDPNHERYLYPFNSCTNCGPRFSITLRVPYDRANTTMGVFPLEGKCLREFTDPNSRRFHHQAISCPGHGPRYFLLDRDGLEVHGNPFEIAAEMLEGGSIGIMKSWGGMHVIARISEARRLRILLGRRQKPFAVMFRDLRTLEKYAKISEEERRILLSRERPIVLLRRRDRGALEEVAPGLPYIGAYLPYSAAHHVLFHHFTEDALIMTSANPPGLPMVIKNEDALKMKADFYLLHDLDIANRVDDSLVKIVGGKTAFVRRSRGFVPRPFPFRVQGNCIAVGAELNNVGAVSWKGRVYATQHIGDCDNPETLRFLEGAITRLMEMAGAGDPECVLMDLHPRYNSRMVARRLAERLEVEAIGVQHHFAHAAALLAETGVEEGVIIAMDGTGYGLDGAAWGGEVIKVENGKFQRIGSLSEFPLVGGDLAVRYPKRTAFGLFRAAGLEPPFEYPELWDRALKLAPRSTSMGRFLDALSFLYGVCDERTYEGEPAMKLERLLLEERWDSGPEPEIGYAGGRKVVELRPIMEYVSEGGRAAGAVKAALDGLLEIALDEGMRIGVTGGVAYNVPIVEYMKKRIPDLIVHSTVPPGDAGIAVGQIAYHSISSR